jgi:hypothetical protein
LWVFIIYGVLGQRLEVFSSRLQSLRYGTIRVPKSSLPRSVADPVQLPRSPNLTDDPRGPSAERQLAEVTYLRARLTDRRPPENCVEAVEWRMGGEPKSSSGYGYMTQSEDMVRNLEKADPKLQRIVTQRPNATLRVALAVVCRCLLGELGVA